MPHPAEVPVNRRIEDLAPKVQLACHSVLDGMKRRGFSAIQFDTLRTGDRQAFLAGKGRTAEQLIAAGVDPKWAWPDCPDGIVTKAFHLADTPHAYGLAFDIVENDATPWTASPEFWQALGEECRAAGCKWGGDWQFVDRPHCQYGKMPASVKAWPPEFARALKTSDFTIIWTMAGAV